MISQNLIYFVLAAIAGISVTLQGPINSELGKQLKSTSLSTFWSFLGGTIILVIYFLIKRETMPSLELIKTAPWWSYLGAITGLIYVSLVIIVIPKLGAGPTTVTLLLVQVLTAILIDHFGLMGLAVRSITIEKMIGIALMIGGVYLINR